ncbi:MAG: DUF1146 domain-containing protein [Bacilli bacterium]|nr:DUF1146 domain-containing protein [Bacilli bacterium]
MSVKFFIYIISTVIVIWSLDSININQIFKKNKEKQAKTLYFILAISLIQLITSFTYEIFLSVN